MKKYDFLLSFGCSYTDGGGLNDQNFHRYLKGDLNFSAVNEEITDEHLEYASRHSYSGYLSNRLGCEFCKYAVGGASNEWIFHNAFNVVKSYPNKEDLLVVVQTTHVHRRLVQIPLYNKAISVNQVGDLNGFHFDAGTVGKIVDYYNLFMTDFFDIDYEYHRVLQQIDLFDSYCRSHGVDVVFLIFEAPESVEQPLEKNISIVDSGYRDFNAILKSENLRICDLPNFPYGDTHASPYGNAKIADLIYKHIEKVYND